MCSHFVCPPMHVAKGRLLVGLCLDAYTKQHLPSLHHAILPFMHAAAADVSHEVAAAAPLFVPQQAQPTAQSTNFAKSLPGTT